MSQDYAALLAAGQKLLAAAATDEALAERLIKNPEQTIADAAGQPWPKGLLLKFEESADGKAVALKPEIDPAFSGELDDKVLDNVAGGKSNGARAGIAFGAIAAGPLTGGLSGTAYMAYLASRRGRP